MLKNWGFSRLASFESVSGGLFVRESRCDGWNGCLFLVLIVQSWPALVWLVCVSGVSEMSALHGLQLVMRRPTYLLPRVE